MLLLAKKQGKRKLTGHRIYMNGTAPPSGDDKDRRNLLPPALGMQVFGAGHMRLPGVIHSWAARRDVRPAVMDRLSRRADCRDGQTTVTCGLP